MQASRSQQIHPGRWTEKGFQKTYIINSPQILRFIYLKGQETPPNVPRPRQTIFISKKTSSRVPQGVYKPVRPLIPRKPGQKIILVSKQIRKQQEFIRSNKISIHPFKIENINTQQFNGLESLAYQVGGRAERLTTVLVPQKHSDQVYGSKNHIEVEPLFPAIGCGFLVCDDVRQGQEQVLSSNEVKKKLEHSELRQQKSNTQYFNHKYEDSISVTTRKRIFSQNQHLNNTLDFTKSKKRKNIFVDYSQREISLSQGSFSKEKKWKIFGRCDPGEPILRGVAEEVEEMDIPKPILQEWGRIKGGDFNSSLTSSVILGMQQSKVRQNL